MEKLTTELIEWLKATREFVNEQAPLAAQEIIGRDATFAFVGACAWAGLCVLLGIGSFLCIRWATKPGPDEEARAIFGMGVFGGLLSLLFGCLSVMQWVSWYCITTFPRAHLLEYFARMT